MKTAISIPDPLFKKAEREAKKRGVSRSRLYAQALDEFLKKPAESEVTRKLNEIYEKSDSRLDPGLAALTRQRLLETEW